MVMRLDVGDGQDLEDAAERGDRSSNATTAEIINDAQMRAMATRSQNLDGLCFTRGTGPSFNSENARRCNRLLLEATP
jgi:hypothetical protein